MSGITDIVLTGVCIFLGILLLLTFIRALKGPTANDRIVCVNMIGTQIIMMIAVLTVFLGEGWLADVAIVYAVLSFIAVVVFTKIYIGIYREQNSDARNKGGKTNAR